MLVHELFDFVTDASITEELAESYLSSALAIAAGRHRTIPPIPTPTPSAAAAASSQKRPEDCANTGELHEVTSTLAHVSIDRADAPSGGRDWHKSDADAEAADEDDELERLAHEDRVFKKVAIPRTLSEVPIDVSERDLRAARRLNKLEGPLTANNTSLQQVCFTELFERTHVFSRNFVKCLWYYYIFNYNAKIPWEIPTYSTSLHKYDIYSILLFHLYSILNNNYNVLAYG